MGIYITQWAKKLSENPPLSFGNRLRRLPRRRFVLQFLFVHDECREEDADPAHLYTSFHYHRNPPQIPPHQSASTVCKGRIGVGFQSIDRGTTRSSSWWEWTNNWLTWLNLNVCYVKLIWRDFVKKAYPTFDDVMNAWKSQAWKQLKLKCRLIGNTRTLRSELLGLLLGQVGCLFSRLTTERKWSTEWLTSDGLDQRAAQSNDSYGLESIRVFQEIGATTASSGNPPPTPCWFIVYDPFLTVVPLIQIRRAGNSRNFPVHSKGTFVHPNLRTHGTKWSRSSSVREIPIFRRDFDFSIPARSWYDDYSGAKNQEERWVKGMKGGVGHVYWISLVGSWLRVKRWWQWLVGKPYFGLRRGTKEMKSNNKLSPRRGSGWCRILGPDK